MTRPGVVLAVRIAAAVASGLAMVASFPPYDLAWLAVPAVAALTLATVGVAGPHRASCSGWSRAWCSSAVLVRWLAVVGTDAWLALAAYCALWIGAVGAATAPLSRLRAWPLWVACAWVLPEALRDRVPLGGFPWGRLAFGQTSTPAHAVRGPRRCPAVTFAIGAGPARCWPGP